MTGRHDPPDTEPDRDAGGHGRFRDFRLTTFAVDHPVSVLMLLAIITVFGLVAYRTVPKEAAPEVTIPMVSVVTLYPGVAPQDMETLVTRVVEEEVNAIADIQELTSTSREGYSNVVAEFGTDMDMDEALRKVRETVDLARPRLPADAEEPMIVEYNVSEFPIMQVNVSGPYDLVRIKRIAETLQERLERIPSILEVQLSGGLEREVEVDVDLPRLKHYGLNYQDVVGAIRDENVTVPGGGIEVGTREYLVRVAGEFEDPALIEDVVVSTRGGQPIYVRDVASVDFGFKDRETYARFNGDPVVTLGIVKRSGENIIETADAVRGAIEETRSQFPPRLVMAVTSDASEDIHAMVSNLENNIISGLILVLAVLLFFLGVRNAGFVAVSIPLSMLLSFIVIQASGFTMNMVVLFSLILALGMLVDNAVVVVENIYRFMEQGHGRAAAAVRGTGEVAIPIVTSTLTTLGAFLPLVFWPGITGEFMGYLPRTLIITLSSSLFVALVIIPVLCALFMRLDGAPRGKTTPAARWTGVVAVALVWLGVAAANLLTAVLLASTVGALVAANRYLLTRIARWAQAIALPWMLGHYERVLRWALAHRLRITAAAVAVLGGTFVVFGALNHGVEFFPEDIPPNTVYAQFDVPSGTRTDVLNRIVRDVEPDLAGLSGMKDSESVVATVGRSSTGGGMGGAAAAADATVTVHFRDYEDRTTDVFETLRGMQERLGASVAGAEVTVAREDMGPPSGPPVNVEIVGPSSERLRRLADRAVAVLENAPVHARLEGLESDMSDERSELVVDVDRERAALYGVSTAKVGSTIRSAIRGSKAGAFRSGNDEYDIMVRLARDYRSDLGALRDLTVTSDRDAQIPVSSVARWQVDEGLGSVRRKNMDRMATVSSDVRAGENSNAVLAEVQETLAEFERSLPPDYSVRYTGQQEDQAEAQAFLSGAFGIALFLIAFVLISQFGSVLKPFIILTSVLMSTVGVLLGLIVFRMPFGIVMTGLGVISLAGVVVNNAIVLIDYVDQLRDRDGLDRYEALVRGGVTRFRPVVLTAVTTVLGLVPLAIGLNLDFLGLYQSLSPDIYWGGEQAAWWGPMAIAVIVGLSFATLLTLVLVPVLYSLTDDAGAFFRRHYRATAGGTEPAASGRHGSGSTSDHGDAMAAGP